MRGLILVAAALLAGCAAPIGADGLPIGLAQALCEVVPGHHCCQAPRPPPPAQPFCTHSLGVPDCWSDPAKLPDHPQPLADTPAPAL